MTCGLRSAPLEREDTVYLLGIQSVFSLLSHCPVSEGVSVWLPQTLPFFAFCFCFVGHTDGAEGYSWCAWGHCGAVSGTQDSMLCPKSALKAEQVTVTIVVVEFLHSGVICILGSGQNTVSQRYCSHGGFIRSHCDPLEKYSL